jgi:hypothetical protein
MRITKRLTFRYWGKWIGFRVTHYESHCSKWPAPRWSGFQIDLGVGMISYHLPRHVVEAAK